MIVPIIDKGVELMTLVSPVKNSTAKNGYCMCGCHSDNIVNRSANSALALNS
jgi:hypothetical protein